VIEIAGSFKFSVGVSVNISRTPPSTLLSMRWILSHGRSGTKPIVKNISGDIEYVFTPQQIFLSFTNLLKKHCQFALSGGGWKTQQVLKLLFSTKTDNPYVILDSKNWLVQNAKVEDLSQHVRGRSTDPFDQFARLCYEKFNFQEPQFYRPVHTPFWIDPTITNSMFDFFNGPTNTCLWFMKTEYPSEFIMYDLYATSRGLDSPNSGTRHEYSKTYWTGDVAPTEEEIKKIVDDKNIKLFSIHLPVLKQMDHAMIEKAVGFSTKYFYWRF
jgi:hypothetical protein